MQSLFGVPKRTKKGCAEEGLIVPPREGGESETIFVSLAKWRKKPTREMISEMDHDWDLLKKDGGNLIQAYWTFGRYDAVVILDAPNEKIALKALMRGGDHLNIETLLAIPRGELLSFSSDQP